MRQARIEVPQRVVREGGEEHDRIEAPQVVRVDVPQVEVQGLHLGLGQELPPGVVARVEADDLVSGRLQQGSQHLTDVAAVSGDEDAHARTQARARVNLRAWKASAKPPGAWHSMPRRRARARKVSAVNQERWAWLGKCASRCSHFASTSASSSGT